MVTTGSDKDTLHAEMALRDSAMDPPHAAKASTDSDMDMNSISLVEEGGTL